MNMLTKICKDLIEAHGKTDAVLAAVNHISNIEQAIMQGHVLLAEHGITERNKDIEFHASQPLHIENK